MPPSALLFPGQGSHADGMDEPYRGTPLFDRGLDLLGFDPFERLAQGTRFQQPALFLCSVAAWDAWRQGEGDADAAEVEPTDIVAAAGHSLGEYAALVAAGALAFDDAVPLVAERGAAMDDAGREQPGGMLAMLGGDALAVVALAERLGLTVANDNAPGQVVLSGPADAIDRAEEAAKAETGARGRRLDVSGAFHSPLIARAADRLRPAVDRVKFTEGASPFMSTVTAKIEDARRAGTLLIDQLTAPVKFTQAARELMRQGTTTFVEVGPGNVLSGLVKRIDRGVKTVSVNSLTALEKLEETLGTA